MYSQLQKKFVSMAFGWEQNILYSKKLNTMYLDRNDLSFRQEEKKDLLSQDKITVFRPGNRIYPEHRWYIPGEVVKARVIDVPWNDKEHKEPIFSDTVELVKIQTIHILKTEDIHENDFKNSWAYIKTKDDLAKYLKTIYVQVPKDITKIEIKKIDTTNLIDNDQEIKKLFENWILTFATLPENNVTNIEELLNAKNFSFTFINHDYAGITPKMRNHIANKYHLDIKNAMVIIQPDNFEKTIEILQKNKKYIGWWLWVGFKDLWRNIIKDKKYWFIHPVANEMQSINFIAHFWEEIHGYNSDASGYTDSLCDKFKEIWENIHNKDIILLWAWGTARGIALELVNRWIHSITILNRTLEKAKYITKNLNQVKKNIAKAGDENMIYTFTDQKIDAIINLSTKWADWDLEKFSWLTPASWSVEENLTQSRQLLEKFLKKNPKIIISDINLTKTWTTPLLDIAKEAWISTLDGKGMVVYQWVNAIWTVFGDRIIRQWWSKEEVNQLLIDLILK